MDAYNSVSQPSAYGAYQPSAHGAYQPSAHGAYQPPVLSPPPPPADADNKLVIAGYVCGGLAFLVFPPGLGLAGTVIGVVNLTKGRLGHGIAQVVLSITGAIIGMAIGIAMTT
jgi:hypothetical protein